jgi:peptidoglycan/LPS O-acetylase OafA/YrhL
MTVQQSHLSHPKYRPDIDGLRAIAVLAVVAFHAFPTWVRGGFIGVDVFFVISGYLISTIIFENLEKGTFSFSEFYARRIRRIFPALLTVLLACFIFGWFALLADEFKQLGRHMAAGAAFVSNFVLWGEVGYFDNAADTKPLLHLWSLGIEEQFYIIWPPLLWFAWKRQFNLLTITILIAIASFVLNMDGIKQDPIATFYSPLTRFWELLCGSLLAWLTLYKQDACANIKHKIDSVLVAVVYRDHRSGDGKLFSNVLSFIGFFLLIYGFWRINRELSFPGKWALIPVMGAVLIITAGSQAWVNRIFLSNKLAVWFGLISFPLYLWHWPLLSFARIIESETPSPNVQIVAVVLSVLLAWLTYRLIERPIRFGHHGKAKVVTLVILMTIVGYVGYNTDVRDGLAFRFNRLSDENKLTAYKIADAWKFRNYPQPPHSFSDPKYGSLRVGKNDDYKILFVGDSHIGQYWNSVTALIDSSNLPQPPSVLFYPLNFPPEFSAALIDDPQIKVVVFSYFWALQYGSDKVNLAIRCCAIGGLRPIGPQNFTFSDSATMDLMDAKLAKLVQALNARGKKVFFILDNPFGEEIDPHSMLSRTWNGFTLINHSTLTRSLAETRSEPVRSRIIQIAKSENAQIIDPIKYLCPDNICSPFSENGDLLYKDYDHLSLYASKNKTQYLIPIFNK